MVKEIQKDGIVKIEIVLIKEINKNYEIVEMEIVDE